jgi:hypothetical protein
MDFVIEVNGFVILAIICVLGAALIAGGIVLYRGGARASARAFGAASVAAGAVIWAIVLVSTPMSSTRGEGPPEGVPDVSGMCAPDAPDCNDTIVVPNTGDGFDGEVLPPNDRIDNGTSGDVPNVDAPTLEPGDADVYGKEVPIGTFDQDGDSEPSTGSGASEGAPVPDVVPASSELQ